MKVAIDKTLDVTGLYCPEPVMMLHNTVRDTSIGEIIKVIATDPTTQRDIPQFCNFLGHELLAQEQCDKQYHFYIRKGMAKG